MTLAVRWFMIFLVLNAYPVRSLCQDFGSVSPGCFVPPELSWLSANQQYGFGLLFSEPYDICKDLFLMLNEEINAADPTKIITGNRDNEDFYLIVTDFVPISEWEQYNLPRKTVKDLRNFNASAGLVWGNINGQLLFFGLVISVDAADGSKISAVMPMEFGQPDVCAALPDCEENQAEFDRCRNKALLDFNRCKTKADNSFDTCAWNDGAIGAGIGGFLGCVIASIKNGCGSVVAIKVILIGCGLGSLVGSALAIWRCYNKWSNDVHNCYIDWDADLRECYLLCKPSIGTAKP